MDSLNELSQFLEKSDRIDVKMIALQELLGLTGSEDGCSTITTQPNLLNALIRAVSDENVLVQKNACLVLVNLSAYESCAQALILSREANGQEALIVKLLALVTDKNSAAADLACMVLANIARCASLTQAIIDALASSDITVEKLINIFTNLSYNVKGCNLHYLGPVFSNLTQNVGFRRQLLDKTQCIVQRLLAFTEYPDSCIRRGGIIRTLKNCCFETEYHDWLLGPDVDILPRLLLPLAGPEVFDDEDNDKLPPELQYLGEDKKREPDSEVRKTLLEALYQLCATKSGREFLRDNNTYVILREYHKWEKDRHVLLACENIIDVLIRTEDEIGEDNVKELNVPGEYLERFEEMDRLYVEDTT